MSKIEKTRYLIKTLDEVLQRYGNGIVSVDYNEITGKIDINQCHGSWSDVIVSGVISNKEVDMRVLLPALGKRHVGYCI